jgi:hypothetical protein
VTPAIKEYIEDKITKAIHNFSQSLKSVDVTISARGGDTGTHGARWAGFVCVVCTEGRGTGRQGGGDAVWEGSTGTHSARWVCL